MKPQPNMRMRPKFSIRHIKDKGRPVAAFTLHKLSV